MAAWQHLFQTDFGILSLITIAITFLIPVVVGIGFFVKVRKATPPDGKEE